MSTLEEYVAMNMKSSTAQMNERQRDSGLRQIYKWVIDVRGTDLDEPFNKQLKELRSRSDGLSEHYPSTLKSTKEGEKEEKN